MTYEDFRHACDHGTPMFGRKYGSNPVRDSSYVRHEEYLKNEADFLEKTKQELAEAIKNKDEKRVERIKRIIANSERSMQRVREYMALPHLYGM